MRASAGCAAVRVDGKDVGGAAEGADGYPATVLAETHVLDLDRDRTGTEGRGQRRRGGHEGDERGNVEKDEIISLHSRITQQTLHHLILSLNYFQITICHSNYIKTSLCDVIKLQVDQHTVPPYTTCRKTVQDRWTQTVSQC